MLILQGLLAVVVPNISPVSSVGDRQRMTCGICQGPQHPPPQSTAGSSRGVDRAVWDLQLFPLARGMLERAIRRYEGGANEGGDWSLALDIVANTHPLLEMSYVSRQLSWVGPPHRKHGIV